MKTEKQPTEQTVKPTEAQTAPVTNIYQAYIVDSVDKSIQNPKKSNLSAIPVLAANEQEAIRVFQEAHKEQKVLGIQSLYELSAKMKIIEDFVNSNNAVPMQTFAVTVAQ